MGLFGKKTDKKDQDNSDNDGTEKITKPVDDSGRKKIIYIVCFLLIAGLVLEGEMSGEDENKVTKSKPMKKKKQKKTQEKTKLRKKPEVKPTMQPEIAKMDKEMDKEMEAKRMVKPLKIAKKVEPLRFSNPESEIKKIEPTPMVENKKMKELDMMAVKRSKELEQSLTNPEIRLESFENEEEKEMVDEAKMKEKEVEKAVFSPAPNYEGLGRGLVYNCVELHWACINRSSYFQCRNNKKWNMQEGKKIKCVDFQVYASVNDCESAQQLNVDKIKDVEEFCQQNSGADE